MGRYGLNQVTLIGRLGADPELRQLDQDLSKVRLRLACTDSYRDPDTGARRDRTEWIQVVLWRGLADVAAQYCRKGDLISIEGRLVNSSWTTPQGEKHSRLEVEATRLLLLESRRPELATQADALLASPGDESDDPDDDPLPF